MRAFFATTAKGMERLLAEELRTLGATDIEERRAGASFSGGLEAAYRACLWSRVASRVLLPLAEFAAPDEDALYQGVRGVRWSEHLGPKQTLAVDFTAAKRTSSEITHSHYGALRTKDAIVDQLRDQFGSRPSVDTVRPDVRINVHLHDDVAGVSIDLSGGSLHRRGYRDTDVPAPLKESLAAAVLLLGGWPRLAALGAPLLDPMCGSGTLPIEAALIAADIAPGLHRAHHGFLGWRGHDAALWSRLVDEAKARVVRDAKKLPPIVGYDIDARAVRAANEAVERAHLRGIVHIEKRELSEAQPIPRRRAPHDPLADGEAGLFVVNPPYGERLGDIDSLRPLYREIGDTLRRRFPGWTGVVLTGNLDLAKEIGLRPAHRHVLYNGAIECRLLEYPISSAPVREPDAGPSWRRAAPPSPPAAESHAFANRVKKNLAHLRKWAKREDVHCYRVYDADIPEYAVAVDLYEDAAHVQEYEPPATVDPDRAAQRLRDIMALLPDALGIPPESIHLKVRRRQRGLSQYEKQSEQGVTRVVREGGFKFEVNLTEYLDTGLFLDHRRLRTMIGELARGRRFLNLYAYTGTATVYAAGGGAVSTTSVDLSNTYLDWARRNFDLNSVRGAAHELIRADCLEWLEQSRGARRYGLVFVAPPTFSNSKKMEGTFDVQRDHPALLHAIADLLDDDGVILFSNHFRRFKMDAAAMSDLHFEDISPKTIPPDFAKHNARIHNSWRITRRR